MTQTSISQDGLGNYFELPYADLPTFGKAPLVAPSQLSGIDAGVFGVPWDVTASPKGGARLGPRRIREESQFFYEMWNPIDTPMVSIDRQSASRRERIRIVDCGDVTIYPFEISRTAESIRHVASAIAARTFPLMLGGDHYVMYPSYQGVCDAHPDLKVGIVQIDAHDDTVSDDPILGRHWCGSPIQRAIEHSSIEPAAVAMIGLRGFMGQKLIQRHHTDGFCVTRMEEVRAAGARATVEGAFESVLRHCDCVYLTVDIDAADSSCAPGCSSPSPGGFLSHEFIEIMRELGSRPEVIALDLVEVAPPLDPTEVTPLFAAHLLAHFIDEHFLIGSGVRADAHIGSATSQTRDSS